MWKVEIWGFKREPRVKDGKWLDEPDEVVVFYTTEYPNKPEVLMPYFNKFPFDWYVYYKFEEVQDDQGRECVDKQRQNNKNTNQ